jgi:hypothetical protein
MAPSKRCVTGDIAVGYDAHATLTAKEREHGVILWSAIRKPFSVLKAPFGWGGAAL